MRIYSLSFVINSFYAVHIAKFTKELNFKIQFKLQFPAIIIGSFVGVNFALQGYGVWSLVVLHLSQSFFTAMFFWIFLSWKPQIKFKYNILKKHLNFGYKMTISGLLDTVYNNLYKIIIGKFYSPIDVGYFTKADEIRFFPVNQISIILGKVTYPLFVKLNEEREHMLKEAYQWSINISLLATSSIMICLVIIAKDLFYLLLGYKWLPAVPYFQILAIASIFKPIATYNLNILKVKGKSDLFLKLEIIKKITGTLLLLCAIRYNIIGIIWTSCITYIVFAYLNGYYSGKFLGYSVFQQLKDSSKILMQISLPSIICYLMYNYILNNQTVFFKIPLLSIAFFFMIFISIKIFNKNIYNRIAFLLKN